MSRMIFAIGLLATSSLLIAENPPVPAASTNANNSSTNYSSSNDNAASDMPMAPTPQQNYGSTSTQNAGPAASDWKHNQPVFTVAAGFSYLMTDLTNTEGGTGTAFYGWYAVPTVQLNRHIGMRTDFEQSYSYHAGEQNRLLRMTGGPVFTFPLPIISKWTTPFVYVEGGATRVSAPGPYIQWDATADGGIGLQLPLSRRFGFQIIPGEYSAINIPGGNWVSNYSAKAGIVLNLYGNR